MTEIPFLFNVNGSFGCGNSSKPDYYNAVELIEHMDRLGVDRSLVWRIPVGSNEALLDDIVATPGASDRLIPAYTTTILSGFNSKDNSKIKEAVSSGRVKALRVKLADWHYSLSVLEDMLREIEEYKPVLLFNCREYLDTRGLLDFAGKFPGVPMVYMEAWHPFYTSLLELMSKRDNIYADISWLHMHNAIEDLTKRFGAERLLFGMGPKSHNGTSIGALMHADISEDDMELIAHGNLERLLGIKSNNPLSKNKSIDDGSLWSKFLRKEPLEVDIVDAHTHLAHRDSVETALECMNKLGINTLLSIAYNGTASDPVTGNRELLDSIGSDSDCISGYFAFNPHYDDKIIPRLDEFFSNSFYIGFKLLNSYWGVRLDDPRFNPMWEYANKHCLPVLIHTWNDGYDNPSFLTNIAPKYKNVSFLLAHSGGEDPGRLEAEDLAMKNPNVYLEFCGSFTASRRWEDTIKKLGNDRIVYGSDALGHSMVWELGRLLSLDVPEEDLLPILGSNIRRILSKRR
jgi:predicted TIM-barrel fold metal-dependent hydrolase